MREAEHTRLLASSHDATSAASSSGSVWSRVALGLGTLGVIAAVAALATSPETLMDITLGLGLSLPRETPARHGLSTKSIRPVASGDGTRPHSALRTEDALVPKLGSHKSGHVATAGAGLVDDSDRDKQFLIPPVVVEKIAGKLAQATQVVVAEAREVQREERGTGRTRKTRRALAKARVSHPPQTAFLIARAKLTLPFMYRPD